MSVSERLAALPLAGLQVRAYRAGDAAAITRLTNLEHEADGVDWRGSVAEFEAWLGRANDNFTAERDVTMVAADGDPIAYGQRDWVDTTDGLREYRHGCAVHPDWRRRGIGRWLLRHNEEEARLLAAGHDTDRARFLGAWTPERAVGRVALLEREGYRPVRTFFDMLRPTMDGIEAPMLPDGLEIRPVAEADIRTLWDADVEAFRDHWGGFDGSDARYAEWRSGPYFDPSLFVVAWDGTQIAGGVINEINAAENEAFNRQRGWLASVFVRRPWRRRGLARALVLRSLEVLRDRGMTSAGLGVDSDNPNGALGLYTRTGFEVDLRSTAYRKPLAG